jgi:predicted nuclease of restriction endonuclease-like (RecB) superfamily
MTKPSAKKPAKAGPKKVSPAVTQRSTKAAAIVSTPRGQSTALAGTRDIAALVKRVVAIIEEARTRVVRTVNSEMVLSYWHIGRELVEFVQGGAPRAEYGEQVFEALSARLQTIVGRGYSVANLRYFRLFYLQYRTRRPEIHHEARDESAREKGARKKRHEARDELATQGFSSRLSWTHYRTLTKIDDPGARAFYEIEAERENWSVPHLERQIHTQLHLRLVKSRDKAGVMELARRGQTVERPIDLIKSPVVLDFLALPDKAALHESDLETAIISTLSQFLLELGKGFAFVARQKRLSFEDEEFFVDLVFYNIILKCYLLIDLKLGKLTHQDVGQMDSYVRLFDAQGRTPGDGPTIGLILCAEKNEAVARYSILHEHQRLFAAKYVTYLPTEDELQRELERERRIAETSVDAPHTEKSKKPKIAKRAKGRKK